MSNSGIDYLVTKVLGDNSKLALYYDFNTGSAFAEGQAGNFTGYIKNVHPSNTIETNNLFVEKITGATEADALFNMTGNFLNSGDSGDFTLSNAKITGSHGLSLNNCTFLFSAKKTHQKDGLIFGSLKKDITQDGGISYVHSSGYNIGINARNQLFFNGIGENGEYILTANEIELANKNICSVSVGGDVINFAKYDLGQNRVKEQSFNLQTDFIKTDTNQLGYLGGGDGVEYYRAAPNFSGIIDKLAIFSGVIDTDSCLFISSGFAGDLDWQSGSVNTVTFITGFQNEVLYDTGYTGFAVQITGNFAERTGWITKSFGISLITGTGLFEGDIYNSGTTLGTSFLDVVLDQEGLVIDDSSYSPTGSTAEATLGLDNTDFVLINTGQHSISYDSPTTTGIIQVVISGVSGELLQIPTGSVKTPVYSSVSTTGSGVFNIVPETGRMFEYKYDLTYFLGERLSNAFYDYTVNTGLFVNVETFGLEGQRTFDKVAVSTNTQLEIQGSLNSQTLLEVTPEVKQVGFDTKVSSTGDFYVTGFDLKLSSEIAEIDQMEVLYETSQTGNILYTIGDSGNLQTGFLTNLGTGISGQSFFPLVFLNGQKIYSGVDYTSIGGNFVWNAPFDVSGKLFSFSRPAEFVELFATGKEDTSGEVSFNKGMSKLYINGMEQVRESFLESASIDPITTGLSAIHSTNTGVATKYKIIF